MGALGRAEPGIVAGRVISDLIAAQGAEAGIVIVDRTGRVGYAHNTEAMQVGIFSAARGRSRLQVMPVARAAESQPSAVRAES